MRGKEVFSKVINFIYNYKKQIVLLFALLLFVFLATSIYIISVKVAKAPDGEKLNYIFEIFGIEKEVPVDGSLQINIDESAPIDEREQNKSSSTSNSDDSNGNSSSSSLSESTSTSASGTSSSASSSEQLSVRAAFYADTQTDTDAEEDNHEAVVANILSKNPSYVIHAGDLMEDGTQASFDSFTSVTSSMRSTKDFYSALGNNDRKVGDSTTASSIYLEYFNYPNNEKWYSVNAGNLHIVVLDSAFSSTSVAQLAWLEDDLQSESSSSRITVVVYHHPTFVSTVMSRLIDFGVDFVIAGHVHSYSHTKSSDIDFFTLYGQPNLGYLVVDVYSSYALVKAYNSNNSLVETTTIENR